MGGGKYQNSGLNPPHHHRRPGGGNWEAGGERGKRRIEECRIVERKGKGEGYEREGRGGCGSRPSFVKHHKGSVLVVGLEGLLKIKRDNGHNTPRETEEERKMIKKPH